VKEERQEKEETPGTSGYVRTVRSFPEGLAFRLPELDIELTERCNNNCIHCNINLPEGDAQARKREMTTGQVKDILGQAAALGCLRVRFTGGEPLLRPDFEEIYLSARGLGMKVLLFTNGRLITPRLADLFARIPPLATIEITVYGMRAESYEAVTRAPGSFKEFRGEVGPASAQRERDGRARRMGEIDPLDDQAPRRPRAPRPARTAGR
jgi:sulfatase maturation enzyme AslB (radical SAM superfamily)